MERFCDKCGSLVSGEGDYCPTCGARIRGAVDLRKRETERYPEQPQQSGYGAGNSSAMPAYPQSYNTNSARSVEMGVGEWALTIFLASLGIIGVILLFIWAFGDAPQPKKNYARAMLIFWAAAVGLIILGLGATGFGFFASGFFDEIFT